MENCFDREFEMRYYEMDTTGTASPVSILTLLEETAADHCQAIGHGLYELAKKSIGWLLLSGYMEMDRYPGYREKITIRTWLNNYSLVRGYRETVILDSEQSIIGRARGLWVFYDVLNRKPIKIFDEIKQKWDSRKETCADRDISGKIEAMDTAGFMHEHDVNRSDTDMYRHVNNIRYLQWAVDAIPRDTIGNRKLHSIDGRFIGEGQCGDTMISLANEEKSGDFLHTIKAKDDGRVCATARTSWK